MKDAFSTITPGASAGPDPVAAYAALQEKNIQKELKAQRNAQAYDSVMDEKLDSLGELTVAIGQGADAGKVQEQIKDTAAPTLAASAQASQKCPPTGAALDFSKLLR